MSESPDFIWAKAVRDTREWPVGFMAACLPELVKRLGELADVYFCEGCFNIYPPEGLPLEAVEKRETDGNTATCTTRRLCWICMADRYEAHMRAEAKAMFGQLNAKSGGDDKMPGQYL